MKRLFLAVIAVLLICSIPATATARFLQGGGSQQPDKPLRFDRSVCPKPLKWLLGADCVKPARQECRKGPIDIHVFRKAEVDAHVRVCKDLFLEIVPLSGPDRLEVRRVVVDPVSGRGHYVRVWSDGGLGEFRLQGYDVPSRVCGSTEVEVQEAKVGSGYIRVWCEDGTMDYVPDPDGYDFMELASTALLMLLMFWLGGLLAFHLVIKRISSPYRDGNAQAVQKIQRTWNYVGLTVVVLALLYIAVSDIVT